MTLAVLAAVRAAGFESFGGFVPRPGDGVPPGAGHVLIIGNAGPAMFERFAAACDPERGSLDDWCRAGIGSLCRALGAVPIYPFDTPPPPFLAWARRAGCGYASPLGLNIHPRFGLWHAYRAALVFPASADLELPEPQPHPCDSCVGKPCLTACPAGAFTGLEYRTGVCATHLRLPEGGVCMAGGCLARHACPVGQDYAYTPGQARFHMRAFLAARGRDGSG